MSGAYDLAAISLPPGIHAQLTNHLAHLARAEDLRTLELATERAQGFVEGVEAARALTPATIEALFIAFDNAATARRLMLAP